MLLDGVAAFKFLFTNGFSHFYAIIRAHMHFYRLIPVIRQKRKKLKRLEGKRNTSGVYMGSIVADYFIRGRKKFSDLPIR
jgi:hypothetical protein